MSRQAWSEGDLSEYLDGRLSPERAAVLEADLAHDPALRRQVDDLRQVVTLMQALPLREPPQNFLLTPAMVAPARRGRAPQPRMSLAWLRLSTVLAALAFTFTAVLRVTINPMAAVPKNGSAPMVEAYSTDREMTVGAPGEATISMAPPHWETESPENSALITGSGGMGGGGGDAGESAPRLALTATESISETIPGPALMATDEGTIAVSAAGTETAVAMPQQVTPTVEKNVTEPAQALPTPLPYPSSTPEPYAPVADLQPAPDYSFLNWLLPLFGGLTVVLGGLTLWFSRRRV